MASVGNDIDLNLGDATLAAMTNLEYDKAGNAIEKEEEEEEVYGIFTGIGISTTHLNKILYRNIITSVCLK